MTSFNQFFLYFSDGGSGAANITEYLGERKKRGGRGRGRSGGATKSGGGRGGGSARDSSKRKGGSLCDEESDSDSGTKVIGMPPSGRNLAKRPKTAKPRGGGHGSKNQVRISIVSKI